MSKIRKILLVALCIMLMVCVWTACDSGEDNGASTDNEQETTQDATSDVENNLSESVEDVETTDTEESTDSCETTDTEESADSGETADTEESTDTEEDKPSSNDSVVATAVTLNKNTLALIKGSSETLSATVAPAEASDKSVIWTTSDANVATVENGTVTAVGAGTATITVTTANGKTATCEVTVSVPETSITLNKTEATVNLGDSLSLVATVTPSDATDQVITWGSSDPAVATVTNGAVSTLKTGTATITATTSNGKTASCIVTVKSNAVIQYELTADCSFYVVTGITGRTNELEIPFLHDGLRVIAIQTSAFEGNTDIQKVVLPNSIEHIYANAFKNCSNLKEINLPNSLIHIGESAFEECSSLRSVTIPYLVETVSAKAFYHCTSLESVTVIAEHETLERTIGVEAFSECTNLKTVTIGNSVETIDARAFALCGALESVSIGDGLKTIGVGAFDYCVSLVRFEMPDTVTTIGHMAFRHAEALKTINFSKKLTAIGNACFQYCVSLDNVELHDGIVTLGESCFSFCSGMKNLRILGNITTFGDSSFYECTGLTSVYFASSTSEDLGINNYVFYNAGTLGDGIILTLSPEACIPDRLFEPQEDQNRPKLVKLIVEDGATKVDYFIKYNDLPYLAYIELPDSITDIKNGTFDNTAWYKAQPEGALYIGNILYGYKGSLDGELVIPTNTVCVAFSALKGQKPTKLTVPFVGASLNGSQNTHFGYIFGAESAEGQNEHIPTELILVTISNCKCEISDTAFTGCEFTVNIDHHWSDWSTTLAETCQTAGEEERNCSVCENTEKRARAVDTNAHKYATDWTIDDNKHWRKCTVVGCNSITDEVGHEWGKWNVTLAATCQAAGSRYHVCSVCEHSVTEVVSIDPAAHEYTKINKSENGHWYSCTVNGCSSTTVVEDHKWGAWHVTSEPTCNTTGSRHCVCSVCEYTATETIDVDPEAHSWNNENTCAHCSIYKDSGVVFTFNESTSTYSITDYTGSADSVIIPSTYKGYAVTSIGDSAFDGCKSLKSITIPSSITSIGYDAFGGCEGLTDVYITDISEWCEISFSWGDTNPLGYAEKFYINGELVTDLIIPNGVKEIGANAFSGYKGITSVTIPDSVTSIGSDAFEDCTGLTGVYITDIAAWCEISFDNSYANPLNCAKNLYLNGVLITDLVISDGVTSIGAYAFGGCSGLKRVTIPDSVTSIDYCAFYGCTGVKSITMGKGVRSIGNNAFSMCSDLTDVYITDIVAWCGISFDTFGINPLYHAENLYINGELVTDLVIPDSVTSIGDYAFEFCKGLTSVTIGNNVTSIGYQAFYGCTGLESITIGKGLTNISYNAFGMCDRLASITVDKGNNRYHSSGNCLIETEGKTLIFTCKNFLIPTDGSVTSIRNYAFANRTGLASITLPDSIISIGESAFANCLGLTSITIPNSVTRISWSAFSGCTGLTSITFNGTTTEWEAISKGGSSWHSYVPATKVVCSDGDVAL